ncbi:hypothetical protein [Methylovulum psychrotolerans]|uniref:hypothetical protein n=1 Tax=Methylovulum psychrotolerans TaxID=1704499 RepID=UPI0018DFDC7C|nr:hypothetical protein [Methylovulum psychrotolerans]
MSARKEFVLLACQEGANIRALCRQFETLTLSNTNGHSLNPSATKHDVPLTTSSLGRLQDIFLYRISYIDICAIASPIPDDTPVISTVFFITFPPLS